jgi:hypothetical protein
MAFTDKDDALHPYETSGYYEWWYFDAQFNNGYICTLALFWRRNTVRGQPSIRMDIYAPDGKKFSIDQPFDPAACRASDEKCDVSLGPNYARQEGPDIYHVVIRGDKAGLDLLFRRRVPGWKVSSTGLMIDDASGRQGWINAVPRADVEGKLLLEGKQIPVRGLGYHDHNWGDTEMGKSFGGWVWGRVLDNRFTVVYGWLFPLKSDVTVKPFVYAAMGNQPIFASGEMELKVRSEAKHQASGLTISTDMEMRGKAPWGVEVNSRLVLTKILDWSKAAQSSGTQIYYFRRQSKCVAEINMGAMTESASSDAIDEYVLIR